MQSMQSAERCSRLWLDYRPLDKPLQSHYSGAVTSLCCRSDRPIVTTAVQELRAGIRSLLGVDVALTATDGQAGVSAGTVMLGTFRDLAHLLPPAVQETGKRVPDGGYLMERVAVPDGSAIVIAAHADAPVLYGVFHFLRLLQTGATIDPLRVVEKPAVPLRMLNHWDDLNGTIERGYAGSSLWEWEKLPETVSPRYRDHARLCASLGINALVLNNVNADPRILRTDYLEKVAALAGIFRKWGIQTYLSANYGSPMRPSDTPEKMKRWGGVGDLDTADPLDSRVEAWWTAKVAEIYALIPDFGGFLIKADSEGMPGPRTYGRTHLDGANMLARVLKPQGGNLIWRAFVYGSSADRARDAYDEFTPLDGRFLDNVILQIKNGPLDFQPREPFTPLFGAMPKTRLSLECQIAKEYLGHATTLAYLGPMWAEVLTADTHAQGPGSTVAKVIDGTVYQQQPGCIAGVANTGDNPDWCGNVFNQANWYAFGRLAWDPGLHPATIADEWIRMTFQCDAATHQTIRRMMLGSHDALVDYSMPLGLNFLHDWNHYDPKPGMRGKYHGADAQGLGIDRTSAGSGAADQYHPEVAAIWNDRDKTPLNYLLWFHHVPWQATLPTGRTLWEELNARYNRGVAWVDEMVETWKALEGTMAPDIHAAVLDKLHEETKLSRRWRDRCLQYFAGASGINPVGNLK